MRSAIVAAVRLALASGMAQTDEYAREKENAIHKTVPGKQLYKEDTACGSYFWRSEKATKISPVAVYYFFGSTEYGQGKLGLYPRGRYHVIVNEEKDPPTAQVILNQRGGVDEVRIQMTSREYETARECFPNQ